MSLGTLILAEDDDTLRQLYTTALTKRGFRVFAVENGNDVLALVPRMRPRLIVLDVMMPFLNGVETCRRARTFVGHDVPILFLTASNAIETLNDCMAAGGNDFLLKSDRIDNLLTRIELWALRAGPADARRRRQDAVEAVAARVTTAAPTTIAFPKSDNLPVAVRKVADMGLRALQNACPLAEMTDAQRLHLMGYIFRLSSEFAGRDATLAVNVGEVVLVSLVQLALLPSREFSDVIENWGTAVGEAAFIGGEDAAATDLAAWREQERYEPTALPAARPFG